MTNHKEFKMSVITVCKNVEEKVEETLCSVIAQSYSNLEYIVVDGASADNTVSIIQKHAAKIGHWISACDQGIYDAMNKGVAMASGEYIWFLGAGDSFPSADIVSRVAAILAEIPSTDILCGQVLNVDKERGLFRLSSSNLTADEVFSGYMHPHQGMVARRQLLLDHPFSLEYRIAADFAFFLACYLKQYQIRYIDDCIALFDCGGISGASGVWIDEYEQILQCTLPPARKQIWRSHLRQERCKRFLMDVLSAIRMLTPVKVHLCGWNKSLPDKLRTE